MDKCRRFTHGQRVAALLAFEKATKNLLAAMEDDHHFGLASYPRSLPSFDEFLSEVQEWRWQTEKADSCVDPMCSNGLYGDCPLCYAASNGIGCDHGSLCAEHAKSEFEAAREADADFRYKYQIENPEVD